MCWSKEVSFLTLCIGTFFNYHLWQYPTPMARPIAGLWQFVMCMQFFEGFSWVSKEIRSPWLSSFATRGAFLFNTAQPLVAAALFGAYATPTMQKVLGVLCVLYTGLIVHGTMNRTFRNLYSSTCTHLTLYWWDWFPFALPLFYAIISISFLSVIPKKLGRFLIGYSGLTLLISLLMYHCSYGSMWCWLVAFAPVATLMFLRA